MLFGKEKVKGQMEVFNDIDGDLINLYKQIKYNCSELQTEIDWLQSRELFNCYRHEVEHNIQLTDLQRAARYLYLIKCSFGSNRGSFATTVKRIHNIIDELTIYKERLEDVIIENRDFEQLIKTYDRPSALFYIDPPYVGSEKYYNKKFCNFTMDDHKRLNNCLKGIKGRFTLSYNECDFVNDAYKGFNTRYVTRNNLLPAKHCDRGEYKEVIITNY